MRTIPGVGYIDWVVAIGEATVKIVGVNRGEATGTTVVTNEGEVVFSAEGESVCMEVTDIAVFTQAERMITLINNKLE